MSTDAATDSPAAGSPQPPPPPSPPAHERRAEFLVAVLLAVATVATAWSSYQAARWSGWQAINFSKAGAARVESTKASDRAGQQTQLDVSGFIAFADAYAKHEKRLAGFYFKRLRPEFKPAVRAWIATRPLTNPRAPQGPFQMPQYHLAARDRADHLLDTANDATARAKQDNQRSDNYILAVVLFASALFFAGISTKLARPRLRVAIVAFGYLLFVGTLAWIATFPVTVSI